MRTSNQNHRRPIFGRLYPMMARGMEAGGMAERRSTLLAGLNGQVLEIGAGDGATFAHYPSTVERVLAIEPEPNLRVRAEHAAAKAQVSVDVRASTAEQLPVAEASMDAVVFAMVLCSVKDQRTALTEAVRTLRPGGQIRFLGHVRADTPGLARVQDVLDATIWPHLLGGCHTGRDTLTALQQAGLRIQRLERFLFPQARTPVSCYVVGSAAIGPALSDPPQPARQLALGERMDLRATPALRESIDQGPIEEVHSEPAMLVDVVAMGDTGAVVGVAYLTHGVDEDAAGTQHPPYLTDQGVDLLGRQRHTQQHVRVDGIHHSSGNGRG